MISQLREFVELIERLNVALGLSGSMTDSERSVIFQGEHYQLSETADPIRALLPAAKKKSKGNHKGQQKTGWKRGSGKLVMNMAEDPSVWPFENGKGVGKKHDRSKKVQAALKKILTGSQPLSRKDLFRLVPKRLPLQLRKQRDSKDRVAWEMTLGALIRNYSRAGYIVRVQNFDPAKEMISLPGKEK